MKKYKRLLLLCVLLLIPVGVVSMQSSINFYVERTAIVSGGSSSSASYSAVSVIGQPATDVVDSPSYQVSGGFLYSRLEEGMTGYQIWLPVIVK